MVGEYIKDVLIPKQDGWIVLRTNKQFYSLKLGGVDRIEQIELGQYDSVDFPLINKLVARVLTDEFIILFETAGGDAMIHSPDAFIDDEGNTSCGVTYLSEEEYQEVLKDYEGLLIEVS
ncbi:hypothetical protein LJY25_07775 [Hymenobacter sp. BT175]|uniref:hypothetical protein n=1 Tax=Hymenobacter translucens TaxID=2886507 RepID=UPI001D0ED346|nr:hypothetical protein [Hymenobacter translucens]MCC2546339.1 hypothetical protein [Hymenobacter translucens]